MALLAVLAVALVLPTSMALADGHEFYLDLYHGINGRSLGLDKDLPVDIYVNVDPREPNATPAVEDFTFKTRIDDLVLPTGEYTFYVTLADQSDPIMEYGPAQIPGGANVSVHAKLSAHKTPTLKVQVK